MLENIFYVSHTLLVRTWSQDANIYSREPEDCSLSAFRKRKWDDKYVAPSLPENMTENV